MRALGSGDRFPLFLLLVLSLNIIPATAVVSMLIALGYVLLYVGYFSRIASLEVTVLRSVLWPILAMMCVGTFVGVYYGNEVYDVGKDVYFFLKVAIFFLFGYICYKRFAIKRIVDVFIWMGVIASLFYLVAIVIYSVSGLTNLSSIYQYRKSIPELPYDPLISIVLLLFFPRNSKQYSLPRSFLLNVQVVAIASTLSRFSILIVLAGFFVKLLSKLNYAKGVLFLALVVAPLTLFLISINVGDTYDNAGSDSLNNEFFGKVVNSLEEIASTDFDDEISIRKNWRAYESTQGVIKFLIGSGGQKALGHGFGAATEIGINIKLGGVFRNDIPTFHNGYVYVLVKLGVIGSILYFVFLFNISKIIFGRRFKSECSTIEAKKRGEKYLLFVLFLLLVFVTLVFFGIFSNAIFNNLLIILIVLLLNYRCKEPGGGGVQPHSATV